MRKKKEEVFASRTRDIREHNWFPVPCSVHWSTFSYFISIDDSDCEGEHCEMWESSSQIEMFNMTILQEGVVGKQSSDQYVLDDCSAGRSGWEAVFRSRCSRWLFGRKEWLGSSLQIKVF